MLREQRCLSDVCPQQLAQQEESGRVRPEADPRPLRRLIPLPLRRLIRPGSSHFALSPLIVPGAVSVKLHSKLPSLNNTTPHTSLKASRSEERRRLMRQHLSSGEVERPHATKEQSVGFFWVCPQNKQHSGTKMLILWWKNKLISNLGVSRALLGATSHQYGSVSNIPQVRGALKTESPYFHSKRTVGWRVDLAQSPCLQRGNWRPGKRRGCGGFTEPPSEAASCPEPKRPAS